MRTRKHAIVSYLFSLLSLIDGEVGMSLFFGSIASYLLYKWWNHPKRQLLTELKKDSQRFQVTVPESYPLQLEFFKIYSKFLRLSTQYPALQSTYRELIDSMWSKLSQKSSPKEWREVINSIDKAWPSPVELKDMLKTSLDKVSSETNLWNEAMAKTR
jgi:hypothetical protein